MAENESLDLGRSRRWQRVCRAIAEGEQSHNVAALVARSLRKTVNGIRKPIYKDGLAQIPLRELVDTIERNHEGIDQIVRECEGHDYAHLFKSSTVGVYTRVDALEKYLSAICDKFFDQISMHCVKCDGKSTFGEMRSKLNQVRDHLRPDITRMAQQLSANPDKPLRPKALSIEKSIVSVDTKSILNESLLGLKR